MSVTEELDLSSDAGAKLKRAIIARIEYKTKQLESPDMTERETQLARGAIQELRNLLADRPPHVAPLRYSGMNPRGIV
jgi:hypothetical protein